MKLKGSDSSMVTTWAFGYWSATCTTESDQKRTGHQNDAQLNMCRISGFMPQSLQNDSAKIQLSSSNTAHEIRHLMCPELVAPQQHLSEFLHPSRWCHQYHICRISSIHRLHSVVNEFATALTAYLKPQTKSQRGAFP